MDPLNLTTIEDDDEAILSDSSTEEATPNNKEKLNSNFTFQADGGGDWALPNNHWDFTNAKQTAKQSKKTATTLDEKIEKRREDVAHLNDNLESDVIENAGDDEDDEVDDAELERHVSKGRNITVVDDENDPEDVLKDKRIAEYFEEAPAPVNDDEIDAFTSLSLSRPILKAIAAMGFVKPTDIQAKTIPLALQGRDICGSAITGSGKTAAFMIPILERLLFRPKSTPAIRVLILVPTRELGAQCHSVAMSLSKFSTIQACLCVGGLSTKLQEAELRKLPDVVIATPGRLIDHIHNSRSFSLDHVEILVIDEADRILEDGFKDELNEIIKNTPKKRQTMLFSATMTENIDELIKLSLQRPIRLFVDNAQSMTSKLIQEFIRIRGHREEARPAILAALCSRTYPSETLIFFRSKAAAHHMKIVFGLLGLKAAELHGNLTQLQRLESLEQFRDKKVDFLLCTDLASRGLDISGIKTVINYDMPNTYSIYVHRCGRTARGDASGRAVSLVGEQDRIILKLALKNSRDVVKHRIVPSKVVQKYEEVLKGLTETIKEIYEEEKEDKLMSQAEMEVNKAENILKYEDEIKSRPARVWFQSETEKAAAKESTKKSEPIIKDTPKRGKLDGLSRKKKRQMQAREEDKVEQAKQKIAARSVKSSLKPKKITTFKPAAEKSSGGGKKKRSNFDQEMGSRKKRK
ncbi:P-loop containing nucleoside triphosphate hydrolase protein [Globomyces pollinis-pini]|nr:P-loop containing nucleoside triphosphate hydrolase protein [Globomyces pollinis-pini]